MCDDLFASRLLVWFDKHGRKDLPWQSEPTPYRVWVSEVMLQQTQVATVIPYYQRFMARFPDVAALAEASVDEVLAHWSGLGYYSRARNLRRAAQIIVDKHKGDFPDSIDGVMELPGIGRSTAGAILALALKQHHAILDGNVKRVLSRYHRVEGWSGAPLVERALWQFAESHTPVERVNEYTQAIMDLGATVCTRSRPKCAVCPLNEECVVYALDAQSRYPTPKPRKVLPVRNVILLIIINNDGELLMERRPSSGIWGGLWSLPELTGMDALEVRAEKLHLSILKQQSYAPFRHTFSHFHLDITPLELRVCEQQNNAIMEPGERVWYKPKSINQLGLPAPIRRLLGPLNLIDKEPFDDPHGELRQAR